MNWKLAEAKQKLSEVVRLALEKEPQCIERRNDAVVVISLKDFNRLTGGQPDFIEYLLSAPDMSDLDFTRDKSPLRELKL